MDKIYNWEQFNEAKIEIVDKKDLIDNWSAGFNVSSKIKSLKKDFMKDGTTKTIGKLTSIVSSIDVVDYNEAKKYALSEYNVRLPKYEQAKDKNYWSGNFGTIANLITCLGALSETAKLSKDKIKLEIEHLKERLLKLEDL